MESVKNFYKNKNILVTGGAGFIGSHLTKKLVSLGAKVTVFDNFSAGKLSNLKMVLSKINVIYSDITQTHAGIKSTANKDLVFHLAAMISVPMSQKFPKICNKINVMGTQNLLDGCKINGVKKFVFSSSCAVYGNKIMACTEDTEPMPLSVYAQSKLDGEKLCRMYAQKFGISIACLRYFNVYGDGQPADSEYSAVVAKFRYNIKNNIPITIFGTGQQTRDFVDVDNVVDANLKVGMHSNLDGDVFNVASGKSISLFELIKKLEIELGKNAVAIKFKPARNEDIFYSQASCEKLKNLVSTF